MANARMAALLARRAPTLGSGSIRVLTPQNTGISSIAKRNAANESDVMISKYNAGQVSNADMKAFLQKQVTSPYTSDSDKTDIQAKLQDFDVLIEKDRLESVFKLAQENTLQKEQAATALAQFYTQRASTMVAGTPAHSQALENAGNWQATVTNIQQSVSKQQRSNYQDQLFQKVNQLPTSSSERSIATAEAYKKLADMAGAQGDVAAQNDYLAKYEQAVTYADQFKASEDQKQSLKSIKLEAAQLDNDIAKLENKSLEEAQAMVDKANTIAQRYADMGDQYNATRYSTMAIQATEKYNKVLSTATATEKNKLYSQQDKDYSDDIRAIQEMYVVGKDGSGNPYTEKDYKEDLSEVVNNRATQLNEIFSTASESDKVYWNGKTRKSSDVIADIEKELNKVNGLQISIEQGTVSLLEKSPSETIGKNTPEWELIDTRFLSPKEKREIQADASGILHRGVDDVVEITQSEYEKAERRKQLKGYIKGEDGKYYKSNGLMFQSFDPESGAIIKQKQGEYGDKLATASQIIEGEKQQLGVKPGEKFEVNPEKAAKINESQFSMSAEEVRKSREKKIQPKVQEPIVQGDSLIDRIAQKTDTLLPKGKVTSPLSEKRTLPEQIKDTISLSPIEAGKQIIQNIKEPVKAPLVDTVKTPVNIPQAVQSGGLTINKPAPVQQQQTPALSYSTPAPKIEYKTAPPVNITQAVQSGGLSTPVKAPAQQPTALQKIATTVKTTSPFSWLKSKLGF